MNDNPSSDRTCAEPVLRVPSEEPTLEFSMSPVGEGALVGGRYRIEGLLGSGGFGQVHRAFDQKLERTVALKILATERLARGEEIQHFEEEARAVARLDHPHIVPVYDAGANDQ